MNIWAWLKPFSKNLCPITNILQDEKKSLQANLLKKISDILPNIKIKNFQMNWFWRFSISRGEKNNSKHCQISIFSLQSVGKNIEGWLKKLYFIFNITRFGKTSRRMIATFFCIFLCLITALATNKKFVKIILVARRKKRRNFVGKT